MPPATGRRSTHRIPLWVKIAYTAFTVTVVREYWLTYTPWNFLFFCDIALLVTCLAIWIESALLVSMQAVAILLPQMVWVIDLLCRVLLGFHVTGITAYMLDPHLPRLLRALSLFHGWLPFFLLWLLVRLGYDRRALPIQSVVGVLVLLVSYTLAPAPPHLADHPQWAVNINYVYGFDDQHPQTLLPNREWVLMLVAAMLLLVYAPTHLVLKRLFGLDRGLEALAPGRQVR